MSLGHCFPTLWDHCIFSKCQEPATSDMVSYPRRMDTSASPMCKTENLNSVIIVSVCHLQVIFAALLWLGWQNQSFVEILWGKSCSNLISLQLVMWWVYNNCETADLCVCSWTFKFDLIFFYYCSLMFINYIEFMLTEVCNNFGVYRDLSK